MASLPDRARVISSYGRVRTALLDERSAAGHWCGELSASALSTATAVVALELMRRADSSPPPEPPSASLALLIDRGLAWIAAHQNSDGGWGDTTKSVSNISTTMLCHAAFHATNRAGEFDRVVAPAASYIERAGGVAAVRRRYGKDQTFSVPILTHCALAGLVDWRDVAPLPFELACLPPQFYSAIRLPVVSYALPALIAIGQVRHHFHKPRNPLSRAVRSLAVERSLRVLASIQPASGGFLEATPLTSFVTMSLAGMGRAGHSVARNGLEFLVRSARPDGSWPIDTNLATWVTTFAVNALGPDFPAEGTAAIAGWLLAQQYQEIHPYTQAAPGGWAWTDLPGGVPDADDTPGAMLALAVLDRVCPVAGMSEAQGAGVRWLLGLQNRDGGWPTFCRGWGTLPFDRSAPDITAHCLRALSQRATAAGGAPSAAGASTPSRPMAPVDRAIDRGFAYLRRSQRADGSWLPLWFGNQFAPDDGNPTYGTARVLAAYRDTGRLADTAAQRGLAWLRAAQNSDGGWGGGPGVPSGNEETAMAAEVFLSLEQPGGDLTETSAGALDWLLSRQEAGLLGEPSPIGFYFAKLWYFEKLYPLIFSVAALRRAAGLYV